MNSINTSLPLLNKWKKKIVKPKQKYCKYLNNLNTNSFFISPTNSDEVLLVIKELSNSKSTGPTSIPRKSLKLFQTFLSKPISLIANLSFSTRSFPDNLKVANVIPIFKKGDCTFCNNYLPISLFPNISKIIEKLMHAQLTMFLNKHNIIYKRQFGFQHNHSTTHVLLDITEKIKQGCDSGKYACGVLLDLQKVLLIL